MRCVAGRGRTEVMRRAMEMVCSARVTMIAAVVLEFEGECWWMIMREG